MTEPEDTLTGALELLRGRDDLLSTILAGQALIWLGSGISRGRFPSVSGLLKRLIEALRNRISYDGDAYHAALIQILQLGNWGDVDLSAHIDTWENLDQLLAGLQERYADVLSIPIPTLGGEAIIWQILDLATLYGDPSVPYDLEHRLIAVLIREGVFQELITTNWDALVEKAHEDTNPARPLHIIACVEELDGARQPTLFKIHGCAVRMLADEARYKPYIVATRQHIQAWRDSNEPGKGPFRDRVRTLLQQQRSVVLGLSFQDDNLTSQLGIAREQNPEVWRVRPPRVVFSKPSIEFSQTVLLNTVYGPEDYAANAADLNDSAIVPMWARPLLAALFVSCVRAKLEILLGRAPAGEIGDPIAAMVTQGLDYAETLVCQHFNTISKAARWETFCATFPPSVSRFFAILRTCDIPISTSDYHPITVSDLQSMAEDPHFPTLAYHRAIIMIAGLLVGSQQARWSVRFPVDEPGSVGQICVAVDTHEYRMYVVESESSLALLHERGFVDVDDDPSAIVCFVRGSCSSASTSRRGIPHRALGGRATAKRPETISLEDEWKKDHVRSDVVAFLATVLQPGA